MTPLPSSVTIAGRFAGPRTSGNGGYTSGRLAAYAGRSDQPVTVTLRTPPPLDTRLDVTVDADSGTVRLVTGGTLVADAAPGAFTAEAVEPMPLADALAAEAAYPGLIDHPFAACFVCGTDRDEGDGLRLRPGRYAEGRTACVWTPDPTLSDENGQIADEFVWSALDCPGGWTSDLDARPLVLGRMTAACAGVVSAGSSYVVVARLLGEDGRKTFTSSALYDVSNGATGHGATLLGRAEHVWIAIDPARFNATS